jgi:alpha-mannosidase
MTIEEMLVLLPCHSLEDFPTYLEGDEAANLLGCWTALWHPALIYHSRKLPTWCRADLPPIELSGRLLAIPDASQGWLPCDFSDRTESERPIVLRGIDDRRKLAEQAIQLAGIEVKFDEQTIADFFALGFCRLHVELLTRISRYTTTIDDIRLQSDVLNAVDASAAGDREEMRQALIRCFEQLCESRRYFYPVDPQLIDLTLLAGSTLGESLRAGLQSPLAGNLLVCGEVLAAMEEREPASVAAVRAAIERDALSIVGGEYAEREFPLLPLEAWRNDLLRGIETYQRVLGKRPIVYGRRRAGLSPLLPQLLCRTGFQAALHFSLDDGQFPTSPNAKIRWGNLDTGVVEAIAQVPFDAARTTPFLELSRRLGESLDRDQVATLIFAHWPAATSIWYEDLRRGSAFAPVLGKFVTLEDYFTNTLSATDSATFEPDDYRLPYLRQDVAAGCERPISRFCDEQQQDLLELAQRVGAMLKEPLLRAVNGSGSQAGSANEPATPGKVLPDVQGRGPEPTLNRLLLNPLLSPIVRTSEDGPLGTTVKIPGMGFARIGVDAPASSVVQAGSGMIEGTTLRNEFCELSVDPVTGSIRSIYTTNSRGNRLSQQIAMRMPGPQQASGSRWHDPDLDAIYSVMAADAVDVRQPNGMTAIATSRGRIIDLQGNRLAAFEQRTRLTLGSPIVEIDIQLTPDRLPEPDPWNYYYAARFAFPDVELEWRRGTSAGPAKTQRARIEAPDFIEATAGRWKTAILTGGLPYHRLVKGRTLDSLLIVHGETCRRFKLAIAFDHPNGMVAARERSIECETLDVLSDAAALPSSGWFFHVNAKGIVATGWEPLENGRGFTARLLETAGAGGQICLQSWQPIGTARQTDFLGNTLCELAVEHDKIWMEVKPLDWIQIEVHFAN